MKTVHKFLLSPRGSTTVLRLPVGAFILRIDSQFGSPYVWVLVDTGLPYDQVYEFLLLWTGDEVPDGFWPVNTFFEHQGNAMVWHGFSRMLDAAQGVANV